MMEILIAIVILGFTLVPVTLVMWLLIYASEAGSTVVGSCRNCGYDLKHLREKRTCPECGQPFIVDDTGQPISM